MEIFIISRLSAVNGMVVLAAVLATTAHAQTPYQTWPTRPVRLIVAQTAGGNSDMVARTYAQRLSDRFGQQVVVDNRGGASGIVATELVVNAQPDGYTLLLAPTAHAINPNLFVKLPYDTLRDLKSISLLGVGYNILVVTQNHAAKSVRDLVNTAKAQPGKLTYGSSGTAGASHLTGVLFGMLPGSTSCTCRTRARPHRSPRWWVVKLIFRSAAWRARCHWCAAGGCAHWACRRLNVIPRCRTYPPSRNPACRVMTHLHGRVCSGHGNCPRHW